MSTPSHATVGIPTCDDDPRILSLALDALAAAGDGWPALIVDMSRTDRIARLVKARGGPVHYVRLADSAGVSDSRNRIVELADTRHVLFLDADAVPRPGWGPALLAAFSTAEAVALVGARIVPAWPSAPPPLFTSTIALELLGMLDVGDRACDLPRVMGTSYALDRERLGADPPFRPDLGRRPGRLTSWEEVALSLTVRAAGRRIRYEPAATVVHHVRPGRLSWRWMLRRVHAAGREVHLAPGRLEPFPRPLTWSDRAFQAVTTPAFVAGRLVGAQR